MTSPRPNEAKMLREIHLLAPFVEGELEQLLRVGKTEAHEAHSNVVIEGELSWGLYLIIEGTVGIFKTNKLTGESYDIGQLQSGSFFGEMSLIDSNPRSATVRALTDCHLFHIPKEAFEAFLAQSPGLRLRFYESCVSALVARLRDLDDSYVISQYQLWKIALARDGKAA